MRVAIPGMQKGAERLRGENRDAGHPSRQPAGSKDTGAKSAEGSVERHLQRSA